MSLFPDSSYQMLTKNEWRESSPRSNNTNGNNSRTMNTPSGLYTCNICNKGYKNKSSLYTHKNRDHGFKAGVTR
uniref:C2H2-type domain-containing protein n=1 Tax=Lepeophtheirus salmonis TaxID=72036 RepID=A0A0K2VEN4_LEPSM